MASLTGQLARRCQGRWFEAEAELAAVRAIVRTAFIDTAACVLAGRDEAPTRHVLDWLARRAAPAQEAAVLFGPLRMDSPSAALVNGVAGHALDFDDTGLAGHPSVVLVPALLAEHERLGVAGVPLVEAYAKGYAIWGELQRRLRVSLHQRGWHPSSVFGTVAAAAAVASLRGLDEPRYAHALGIAASAAGGVVANFGSMTKPLHIGHAVRAGIEAVDLSQAGIDASPDALDGPAGLLVALAGDASRVDLQAPVPPDLETTLLRLRPGIKKYPVCYALHRLVDGALDLAAAHRFPATDVAAVHGTLSETAAAVVRHHQPATVTEARFSAEFALAAAIVHRRLGLAETSQVALEDPSLRELMGRVSITPVQTQCPLEPSFAYTDELTITLRDGRVLRSGPIRFARGHAERPIAEAQLLEKLESCAGGDVEAHKVLQRVERALA